MSPGPPSDAIPASDGLSEESLQALLRISQMLSGILEGDTLLRRVLESAMETVRAERGFVVTHEGATGQSWEIRASHNVSAADAGRIAGPSSKILARVREELQPVLVHDAQTDPRFEGSESVMLQQITSAIAVPMVLRDELLGVIYVDSRRDRSLFTEENLAFFRIFAIQAALAYVNASRFDRLQEQKNLLQAEMEKLYGFPEIVGSHPKMQEVFALMRKILGSDISVLLLGESGTGKERVAQALHYNGPRRDKPFVAQFCGNLSEHLLESELFGHKRGAFTGAVSDKRGLMEIADGGTFFLDEIGDISANIQTKLLRVVQDGVFRRVGGTESHHVDLRLISATNKDLKEEVREGRFREDLYYRLNVVTLELPPLRERIDDIPLLCAHFLERLSRKQSKPPKHISRGAMQMLRAHPWPGNVRELENSIERAVVLSGERQEILPDDLLLQGKGESESGIQTLKEHERDLVLRTLEQLEGNKTRTADALGVSLRWLHYRLKEWNVNSD